MPHVSESRVQPEHDGHDRLLVAALAAGDLAGTDRDHALRLTGSCAACAELHDDLLAIARATAAVPPPVTARPRDFQLTAADAARLRPAGWRRAMAALRAAPFAAARPLGAGLATLGLVGLLIGNVPLGMGGSASSPNAAAGSAGGAPTTESTRDLTAPVPAASSADAAAAGPAGSAAASMAPEGGNAYGSAAGGASPPSGGGFTGYEPSNAPIRSAVGDGTTAAGPKAAPTEDSVGAQVATSPPSTPASDRPFNIVFALAIVAGLALIAGSMIRRRARG